MGKLLYKHRMAARMVENIGRYAEKVTAYFQQVQSCLALTGDKKLHATLNARSNRTCQHNCTQAYHGLPTIKLCLHLLLHDT